MIKNMNNKLLKNNYLLIDNFISAKKAKSLYDKFKKDSELYADQFNFDSQCPKSLAMYDYKYFIELLIEKTSFMNKIIGEVMFPTYSYSRIYANGEILKKHKDRPACEVSVTLHLGGDKDWEIFFTKPNNEVISVILKPGQAVIYLGCISEHWRNAFEGNEYGQVFLHYVRANGPNWDCYFDKNRK